MVKMFDVSSLGDCDETVEMCPAYVWDCPGCGKEVFVRGTTTEMSEEDLQELREEHGVRPDDKGHFIMMPKEVKCSQCNRIYQTSHYLE